MGNMTLYWLPFSQLQITQIRIVVLYLQSRASPERGYCLGNLQISVEAIQPHNFHTGI